uniref:Uncharacterized protein n=1 Tax=Chelonoidis abingdonii TaxID=106734 RepID=A0A8C0IV04_CHEAB
MSVCEDICSANYRKCVSSSQSYAWVTLAHTSSVTSTASEGIQRSQQSVLPANSASLAADIAWVSAGLRQSTVLDISSRALAFWTIIHSQYSYFE